VHQIVAAALVKISFPAEAGQFEIAEGTGELMVHAWIRFSQMGFDKAVVFVS